MSKNTTATASTSAFKVVKILPRGFSNEALWLHGTTDDVAEVAGNYDDADGAVVRPVSRHRTAAAAKSSAEAERRRQARHCRDYALQDWSGVIDATERLSEQAEQAAEDRLEA